MNVILVPAYAGRPGKKDIKGVVFGPCITGIQPYLTD